VIGISSQCKHCNRTIVFIDGSWRDFFAKRRCEMQPRRWYGLRRLHEAYPQTKES
jgi:hypothetical protein